METKKAVEPKALGKISLFRSVMSKLSGYCSYCGKRYVSCHSEKVNLFFPLPQNGKCCPDGHEGYVDVFMGWGNCRQTFDLIETPPSK
ncbi:hypothetical protein K9M48_02410 [Candidatus Gracilibacteria bacterium]|nr:hypothetical protein [Candidatus Gracilibacteria bacterium]